jgi:hypothetical protein
MPPSSRRSHNKHAESVGRKGESSQASGSAASRRRLDQWTTGGTCGTVQMSTWERKDGVDDPASVDGGPGLDRKRDIR